MNKYRLNIVSLVFFYGMLLKGAFAADQGHLNERIFNATPLKEMIGRQLSSCSEKEISHGAYIAFDFPGELDSLKERLLETYTLEERTFPPGQEEAFPSLAKKSQVKVTDIPISQKTIKNSLSAAHHVLSLSDNEAKIKISPILLGHPQTMGDLLEKNILALKYLMTRDEIKVATLCFDFLLLFDESLMKSPVGEMFLDTLQEFTQRDKVLIVGIGEVNSSFPTESFLACFGKFLQESSLSNRIIVAGATAGREGCESPSQFSRNPGMLNEYLILAPGSNTFVAASVVSAAVLTLLNEFPSLTIGEVRTFLFQSANPDGVVGDRDLLKEISAHGFLDVDSARLLCHERSQSKKENAEVSLKLLCKHSKCWGSVYTSPHEERQFWVPDEGKIHLQEGQWDEDRLYFPHSISPHVLFPYPLTSGFVQAFYLEKDDISQRSLNFFGVENAVVKEGEKMKGLIIGYRYYDEEKNISIIVYPKITTPPSCKE